MSHDLIDGMPRLIQAGMGIHVSSSHLANRTARLGALGVVSGAALRHVIIEDIRAGNSEAIELAQTFPVARYVDELLAFAPGGTRHMHAVPIDVPDPERGRLPKRLSVMAAYVEVMRARRGHRGKVGINVMWKCSLTVLPTIYGAMLAGVDALLCGAGVPMELPDIVRRMRAGEDLEYLPLTGTGTHVRLPISEDATAALLSAIPAPRMIPILSNYAFSKRIVDIWAKEHGARPFAFVLEHHAAGGHNAPPRNKSEFTAQDDVDSYFDKVKALGVPIYVAGAFADGGSGRDLRDWIARGAYGIQVGSRFALCSDSGMRADLRERIIAANADASLHVATSAVMSPTGYPLKVVPLADTIADPATYAARERICNRLYLAQSHFETTADGAVIETYVCPAMPEEQYVRLGGDAADTADRVCLCNGLLSTAGYYSDIESPLLTLGMSGERVTAKLSAREVTEDILGCEYVVMRERELSEVPLA